MPSRLILIPILLVACGAPASKSIPSTPTPTPAGSAGVASAPAAWHAPAPGDAAGRIDGEVVTVAQLDQRIDPAFKDDLASMENAERDYRLAEERLRELAELVDERLLIAEALRVGIEVLDTQIDDALLEIRKQNQLTEAELAKALADTGYTMAAYRTSIREQVLVQALADREARLNKQSTAEARRRLLERLRPRTAVVIELVLPAKPKLTAPVDASGLLTVDEVAAALGHKVPAFTTRRLGDEPPSRTYDSLHFQATGKAESFDLAIRIWKGTAEVIDTRWQELPTNWSNAVVEKDKLATESFGAREGAVFAHAFLDRPTRVIVLVTCGDDLCKTADDVLAIARVVSGRLDRL